MYILIQVNYLKRYEKKQLADKIAQRSIFDTP